MNRIHLFTVLFITAFALLLSACSTMNGLASPGKAKIELTVSAASSLQGSLQELQTLYEKRYDNVKLLFNFGGSGALQQQIEQGAPVDLFISAGSRQVKALVDKQLVSESEQRNILTNELVLVTAKDSILPLSTPNDLTLSAVKKIAVGEPGVPAGDYAKESLMALNIWSSVESKLVLCKDVRQVLTYVESGNVEAGIVYKSDLLASTKVKAASVFASVTHSPIEYPAAVIQASKHKQESKQLYEFLQTKEAVDIFKRFGFQEAAVR